MKLLPSLLLAVAIALPAAATPLAPPQLRATLVSLERDRAEAIAKGDAETLRRLMDRSYLHVESRGRVRSKAEILTLLTRQEMQFRAYEIESAEVQVLGKGDAAIVTGVFQSIMQSASGPRPFRGRYARVWVRQPDGWKNTYHQVTAIQTPTLTSDNRLR